eukprot:364348-Chlamydomonas_euryale.AAC.4
MAAAQRTCSALCIRKAVPRDGDMDGSIRAFRIYRTFGIYGIYGRQLEAMYGTRTRMSALEGCLAALRCGASAQRPSSFARRIHGPRRHSFVEHGRR